MNPKNIKLLKNLSTGLVVVAVVFAFLITGIRIFGVQVFGVLTGSMEPTYPTGSLIYVKDVDTSELRVNDVITFSLSPNVIATHRIVELVPDENNPSVVRFRTKGDANDEVDASLVSANNLIGKVMFAVPQLGYLASYIQEPPGLYVAILVCALMIGFVFYTDSLENKQKQNSAAKPGTETAKSMDLTRIVNRISTKLLGKPLIKPKKVVAPETSPFQQGYVPVQPTQQYGYTQQMQQPYYGMPNQYPQQNAGLQGYGQPVNQSQQPYYQQPAPQQYYNPYQPPVQPGMTQPSYQQQTYQQPYQQPISYPSQQGYQQPYAVPSNQDYGNPMQNGAPVQRRSRRTERK